MAGGAPLRLERRRVGNLLRPRHVDVDLAVVPARDGLGRALEQQLVLEVGDLVDEPLERGHVLLGDDPVEVQDLGRGHSPPPLVPQERCEHGRARGHSDAGTDDHGGLVVREVLPRGRVGTVDAKQLRAVRAELFPQNHLAVSVDRREHVRVPGERGEVSE